MTKSCVRELGQDTLTTDKVYIATNKKEVSYWIKRNN